MADDEVINILAELTFNMEDYNKAVKYSSLYLVSKPRDVEKLFIKAKSLEELKKDQEASQVYNRILELQPYNTKAKDSIKELEKF
jgi:Flp pilus assembly protein TadD